MILHKNIQGDKYSATQCNEQNSCIDHFAQYKLCVIWNLHWEICYYVKPLPRNREVISRFLTLCQIDVKLILLRSWDQVKNNSEIKLEFLISMYLHNQLFARGHKYALGTKGGHSLQAAKHVHAHAQIWIFNRLNRAELFFSHRCISTPGCLCVCDVLCLCNPLP